MSYKEVLKVLAVIMLFSYVKFSLTEKVINEKSKESNKKVFIPTREWQRVEEGQAIPAGLHIKMDLEKGEKWAKLMDDDKSKALSVTKEIEEGKLNIDDLKEKLKKFKKQKQDEDQDVKKKFRTMDEIKSELEDIDLVQEEDFDAMKRLLEVAISDQHDDQQRVMALQDLEYHLHQVDNANDFTKLNGLQGMIDLFSHKNPSIREESIHVCGTAIQGNPAVQVKAVELQLVQRLLEVLRDNNEEFKVKKKCLYSLSCLLRHFPIAQHIFTVKGGFSDLANLFLQKFDEKLVGKALQLVSDIKQERLDLKNVEGDEMQKSKQQQYNRFNLTEVLMKINWNHLLISTIESNSMDLKEKCARAMLCFMDIWGDYFNSKQVCNHLKTLLKYQIKGITEEISEVDNFLNNELMTTDYLLQLTTNYDLLDSFITEIRTHPNVKLRDEF